jgi:signal transduction histidine kinase
VSARPQRFGLQAWLVAAFVALGAIASLAVALVVLPTLESSIRKDQAETTGAALIGEMREARQLDSRTALAEVENLALELRGDVRLWTVPTAGLPSVIHTEVAQGLLPRGELTDPGRRVLSQGPVARYQAITIDGRQVVQAAYLADVDGVQALLEAAVPVQGAEGQIAIVRRRVLLSTALVLLLASLAGIGIARLLGARLRGLAGTASTLAAGDLSARAAESAPQELASLGRSINTMAERLQGLVAETVSDRDRATALVASLSEGVLAVSDGGEVTIANSAAQRLLGLPRGAASITPAELPPAVRAVLDDARRPGAAPAETEAVLADGAEVMISASPPVFGVGVVLTLRDVTEERRLARARRDLIANVSHELKTPLTAIKGFLELLESDALAPERRAEFLDLMSVEVGRLERLVAEQLELARLDAGALVLEREPVDLGELAAEVAASRRLLAEREGVDLTASAPTSPVVVDADPARIEQMLLILLDNAVRHTPRDGKITVAVGRDGGNGTLSVRDTGSGIPLDAQAHVFDRFYQADPSRQGQGLGLGLAIASGLAEAHGGAIDVRSAPLVGSVFTVRLPLATAPAAVSPPPEAPVVP